MCQLRAGLKVVRPRFAAALHLDPDPHPANPGAHDHQEETRSNHNSLDPKGDNQLSCDPDHVRKNVIDPMRD